MLIPSQVRSHSIPWFVDKSCRLSNSLKHYFVVPAHHVCQGTFIPQFHVRRFDIFQILSSYCIRFEFSCPPKDAFNCGRTALRLDSLDHSEVQVRPRLDNHRCKVPWLVHCTFTSQPRWGCEKTSGSVDSLRLCASDLVRLRGRSVRHSAHMAHTECHAFVSFVSLRKISELGNFFSAKAWSRWGRSSKIFKIQRTVLPNATRHAARRSLTVGVVKPFFRFHYFIQF